MKAPLGMLEKMAQRAKADLVARQRTKPFPLLSALAKAAPKAAPLEAALRTAPSPRIVAELRRQGPGGILDRELDVTEAAKAFSSGGAAALCVATETAHYGGSADDLARARAATKLPILRRDLFIDPYQLAEARAAGVGAVWLHAAVLSGSALGAMLRASSELGLGAMVEVSDADSLGRALDAGSALVFIDPRESADETSLAMLAAAAHRSGALVLTGGAETADDVARLTEVGADAVVIGAALLQAADRARAVRRLRGET